MGREKGHTPWNKGKFKYPQLNDREWLHQKYDIEGLSSGKIADIVGCNNFTAWEALKRQGIQVCSYQYPLLNDREWLYQKYWINELFLSQIANIVGCSETAVWKAFKRLNIPCRTKSERVKGEKHWNYGKELSEETKKKLSEALGGANNPNYGKQNSKEKRQKISEALKGHTPWNKGKKGVFSEETRQKIREARKHQKDPRLGTHHSEVSKAKMREARKHRIFPKHHTKPERIFEGFCKKDNLPFKYTGDGSFWIGEGKDAINPDFTHLTKKIVVEVFSWFHDELRNRHVRPKSRYGDRKKILKKYGYKMIVFWQDDLDREDAEARVVSVLQKEKVI